jgi:hypothetical protein
MYNDFRFRPNRGENTTPLKIEFTEPVIFERIPESIVSSDSIEIDYFVDSPRNKIVIAYPTEKFRKLREIVLWKGAEYDAIGQWTESDAINRIKEIFETEQ